MHKECVVVLKLGVEARHSARIRAGRDSGKVGFEQGVVGYSWTIRGYSLTT